MISNILRHALLLFFGIGTAVAALEICARVLPIDSLPGSLPAVVQSMRLHANTFYRRDPYFRYITGPNLNFLIQHRDFTYRVKTTLNLGQAGFRGGTLGGPAWGVAVGDSFTFGMGVDQESTWAAQLAKLARREIINLSVPGWGPQQYTRAIERYGTSLNPKIFFYAIYRNDLQDVLLFDQWLHEPGYEKAIESFLRTNSIAFNLWRFWTNPSLGWEDIRLDDVELKFSSDKLKQSLNDERNNFNSAWSLTEREIELAMNYSKRAGATFVLLYLPSKEEAYWELIKLNKISLKSFDDSIEIFRTHIMEFCKTRQILCLDLTPALRTRASQGAKLYFPHDSHWTEAGNRLVADEIYGFLTAKGTLQ
jgi:SGNH hydrolase-like domain, acetyltransferase AlgX